jgi:hypothetical protein
MIPFNNAYFQITRHDYPKSIVTSSILQIYLNNISVCNDFFKMNKDVIYELNKPYGLAIIFIDLV